jgi:hypothetical protein
MRRLCLAACAALLSFAATGAQAGECCWSAPTVVYASPVTVVVPPTGYLLDPSDAHRPIYVVNQGPVYSGPDIIAVPTYSEGGYAYPYDYPYVRSYYGDRWFVAPPRHRSGWGPRHGWRYGFGERRDFGHPRIVRVGYGFGNLAAPYGAYRYRPAPGARVIHVQPMHVHHHFPQ